jgi:hypothetical protein
MLGKSTDGTDGQCANGFCVTGPLPIALDPQVATYTAGDGTNDALFGWFDTPATDSPSVDDPPIDADGTYNVVQSVYDGTAGPVGLAVFANLAVQVECLMAVDSGGDDGVSACTGGDNDGQQCDPANDNPDGSNTDCTPVDVANTCDAVTDDASPTPDSALLAIPVN